MRDIKEKEAVGLVAEMRGKLVGWAVICKEKIGFFGFIFLKLFGWAISQRKKQAILRSGYLGFIFLIKEARGAGIAEELLLTAITEAERVLNIKKITLGTCAPNEPAIKLYRKCGFKGIPLGWRDKKTRNHYGEIIKRVKMERKS